MADRRIEATLTEEMASYVEAKAIVTGTAIADVIRRLVAEDMERSRQVEKVPHGVRRPTMTKKSDRLEDSLEG